MISCPKCKKENPCNANFCMNCGEKLEKKNDEKEPWDIGEGGI